MQNTISNVIISEQPGEISSAIAGRLARLLTKRYEDDPVFRAAIDARVSRMEQDGEEEES